MPQQRPCSRMHAAAFVALDDLRELSGISSAPRSHFHRVLKSCGALITAKLVRVNISE